MGSMASAFFARGRAAGQGDAIPARPLHQSLLLLRLLAGRHNCRCCCWRSCF